MFSFVDIFINSPHNTCMLCANILQKWLHFLCRLARICTCITDKNARYLYVVSNKPIINICCMYVGRKKIIL